MNEGQTKVLSEIDEEVKKYAAIELQLYKQKQRISDVAAELIAALPEQDQKDVVSAVYWFYTNYVTTSVLAEVLDVKTNFVCQYVNKRAISMVCRRCKKDFNITVTSRSDLAMHKRITDGLCEECSQQFRPTAYSIVLEQHQRTQEIAWLRNLPYSEYLETDHWRSTRAQALKRAKYRCQLCGAKNTELHVHHNSYENIGAERNEDLIVLCAECCRHVHGIEAAAD